MRTASQPKSRSELFEEYKRLENILHQSLNEIHRLVSEKLASVDDPRLIHVKVSEKRVKRFESLYLKIHNSHGKYRHLNHVPDLLGIRVVCANLEDIDRVERCILQLDRFQFIKGSRQDWIITPQESGYRALHFNIKFLTILKQGNKSKRGKIPCEIQIRTALQDSWAFLSHQDIYKEQADLPEEVKRLSIRLADVISVSDRIAQDIRELISRPRLETSRPTTEHITDQGIAFIFQSIFKKSIPGYLIRIVSRKCSEYGIHRLDTLDRIAKTGSIKALMTAYRKHTRWDCSDEELFPWLVEAASAGVEHAVNTAESAGKRDWEEINETVKREIMPDSLEEFLDEIGPHDHDDDPSYRIQEIAELFDSLDHCSRCGTPMVDVETLSAAIREYYGIEDLDDNLEQKLYENAGETGDSDYPDLCSYCGYQYDKLIKS